MFGWGDLGEDGKRGGENRRVIFCVIWLGEKRGGILVGPKHFLPWPTKNESLQFGGGGEE